MPESHSSISVLLHSGPHYSNCGVSSTKYNLRPVSMVLITNGWFLNALERRGIGKTDKSHGILPENQSY
jgi:hypothetical protein